MNIIEVTEKFPTELDAVKHFEKVRWRKGVECPYCSAEKVANRSKDHRFLCLGCMNNFSVTVNTQLHRTRVPLKTWLYAFSIVSDAKKGLSALQLQRNIDVSYPTAWAMYHKIRELMTMENEQIQLEGVVEMDETFIGGKPRKMGNSDYPKRRRPELDEQITELTGKGHRFTAKKKNPAKADINPKTGRGTDKIKVAGIVQRNGDVIAEVMTDLKYPDLKKMVEKYVDEKDSVLVTDSYRGYRKMSNIIDHIAIDHQQLYSYRGVNTNSIESFWAIVKRGIIGQYHQVSPRHLPKYIAEFVFKYNNRQKDDMFQTLVRNSMLPLSL